MPLSEYVGVKVKPLHIPDSLIKYIERELEGDIISGLKEEIASCKNLEKSAEKLLKHKPEGLSMNLCTFSLTHSGAFSYF